MTQYNFYNPRTSFNFLLSAGCAAYPDTIYVFNALNHTHNDKTAIKTITHETIHLVLWRLEGNETTTKFDNIAKEVLGGFFD